MMSGGRRELAGSASSAAGAGAMARPPGSPGRGGAVRAPLSPTSVRCRATTTTTDVASLLRDKEDIIVAQARRIAELEREAEGVRKDRDSLATKLTLLTYKLEMYSKDLHDSRRCPPPTTTTTMNPTDAAQAHHRDNRGVEQLSYGNKSFSYVATSSKQVTCVAPQFRDTRSGVDARPFSPQQQKTTNSSNLNRASPSDKLQQRPHRLQKRTSDEDEKIKRSRDWDYELSQDLQAKQIEMLEKKYGGSVRAGHAARIIQQAYRQYCLNRNFAKLRLEADTKRLSRRFTDFGRSKTLWTDMVSSVEYTSTPPIQRSVEGQSAVFGTQVYENLGPMGRTDNRLCNQVISHSSAAFSSYYCRVLQKTLSMSATASERSVVRESQQPPVRYQQNADLGTVQEMSHDFSSRSSDVEKSKAPTSDSSIERALSDSEGLDWPVEKSGPGVSGYNYNGNDDDLGILAGTTPSYVDHNLIDNNLDFDIEGNTPDTSCVNYGDLPVHESPCYEHKYIPVGMPMTSSQVEQYPGYYEGIQVCRIPASMAPPPVPTSSPSGYAYSSLRLCTLKHGTPSSSSALESLGSRQPATGSPIWKRKNFEGGFVHAGETRDPNDRGPASCGGSTGMILPQAAYIHGMPTSCGDCTQLYQLSHHCHHHHHHHHHHQHANQPQSRVSDKQRKRIYRIGLNLFNKKPEKGIRYLIDRRFLDNRPNAVARFLIARKGLSKQMIGEYLGNLQKQFNMEVLRCFAEEIDLTGTDIDVALRKFQSHFRMPGEAQKIERLMEAFASQYCQCNPNVVRTFRRADTVFLLAFATIMLNTDLHNKSIKPERKMKPQDFIRNLRGIDDGEDIDPELLMGIYGRIKLSEFQPGSDHVTQVAKVEQSIIGKRPQLTALHRRLVCYCRLYEVQDLSRREKLGSHQREVFLFNDMLMVTKILSKKKNNSSYTFRSSFSLSGMIVYLFDTSHYKYGIRLTCSSNKKDYIMLYARNEHDRSKFVEDLKEAILEMNEMEALRIEEELQKQKIQLKHCNYNRHSKDSGVVDIELIRPSDFSINRHSTADCISITRAQMSGSLVDMNECGHRGSAGSLDSGLVSIHAQCDHITG